MSKQIEQKSEVPPTEVRPQKQTRRRFTVAYKRRILTLADGCTQPGDIGRLLRQEGLYSSHLTHWRKQQLQGVFDRSEAPVRGPKPKALDEKERRIRELERDNALLLRKVHQQTLRATSAAATLMVIRSRAVAALPLADDLPF